jgi:beta-lactamase regulating signal transducer with metallopeptidase domain
MTETINRIAATWLNWQWAMLWQTAILIGVVAILDLLIRKRAWPQLRYALWLLVFIKLILPPSLVSPLSLTSRIPAMTQQVVEHAVQTPPVFIDSQPTAPPAHATPAPAPAGPQPVQDRSVQVAAPAVSWPVYAMAAWLAGVVALGIGLHIRLRQISKEHMAAEPQSVPDWFGTLVVQTAAEFGLRRAPQVVFSSKVCCPAVFGVLRPVLLFPSDHLPATQQDARHILLHELAHIKRGICSYTPAT